MCILVPLASSQEVDLGVLAVDGYLERLVDAALDEEVLCDGLLG